MDSMQAERADLPLRSLEEGLSNHARINVYGMSCASCAGVVRGAAEGLSGVLRCDVSVLTNSAQVAFDPNLVSLEAIVDNIEAVGFDVEASEAATTRSERPSTFAVSLQQGSRLEELRAALDGIAGVHKLDCVNGQLRVFYFPSVIGARSVLAQIAEFAFHDQAPAPTPPDPSGPRRRRLLQCFPAALIVMMLSMWPDALPGGITALLGVSLCALVLCYGGFGFHVSAVFAVRHCAFTMDVLVSTAMSCLFVYGTLGTLGAALGGRSQMKFLDSLQAVAVLTEVLLLGRCIEESARQKTKAAISEMSKARPPRAMLVKGRAGEGGREREELEDLPNDLVQVGDLLRVDAGHTVPADGTLCCDEEVQADESLLTGESQPVSKSRGSELVGGSVVVAGSALMEVTAVGSSTTLSEIIRLVETAQLSSPRVQRVADWIAGYFVPTIFCIAGATFVGWALYALAERQAEENLAFALDRSMSVLMIACPCALGLATPTAVMVATGIAARRLGALVKSAESFESLSRVRAVVLDKTGTLTRGQPSVVATHGFEDSGKLWLYTAVAEAPSPHPLAKALTKAAREAMPTAVDLPDATGWRSEVGSGVECTVEGVEVRVGSEDWCSAGEDLIAWARSHRQDGCVVVFLAVDRRPMAAVALRDEVHPSSCAAVDHFVRCGVEVWMCTGDNEATALAIAAKTGIDPTRVVAKSTPETKVSVVKRLQSSEGGRLGRKSKVVMVGDGVNDAPALASADIGVAVGAGSHLTCDAADVVLAQGSVGSLVDLTRLSRATVRTIYRNFFWAFIFNGIGLPFAAGVFYFPLGVLIPPMFAGMAMACSSITVVCSSLLLRTFRAQSDA